ncbi:hypothetical protein MRB53_042030 [Persea americana]|nr:hypothetical protein MRB53_042030 [Persea americana]
MSDALHRSLLRPAVIHILRAAGFHSCRPSVLDVVTDLCARYLFLLGSKTVQHVYDRTAPQSVSDDDTPEMIEGPTVTDIRLVLNSVSFFTSTSTPVEDEWHESLRKPLSSFPEGVRDKERKRRDVEDTKDVQEFVDWMTGPVNAEIQRIAGVAKDEQSLAQPRAAVNGNAVPLTDLLEMKEDYLAILKKKHSKTGEEARFAATVLGKQGEPRPNLRIEGGPESISAWATSLKRKHDDYGQT